MNLKCNEIAQKDPHLNLNSLYQYKKENKINEISVSFKSYIIIKHIISTYQNLDKNLTNPNNKDDLLDCY